MTSAQMGIDADVKGGQGRFACLVAHCAEKDDGMEVTDLGLGLPGASVPPFFKYLLAEQLQARCSLFAELHQVARQLPSKGAI